LKRLKRLKRLGVEEKERKEKRESFLTRQSEKCSKDTMRIMTKNELSLLMGQWMKARKDTKEEEKKKKFCYF
jgi:hypothetical protein